MNHQFFEIFLYIYKHSDKAVPGVGTWTARAESWRKWRVSYEVMTVMGQGNQAQLLGE